MGDVLTAFVAVFVAELPDKTMLATLLLTARSRRPVAVWLGVTAAFAIHVTVASAAGALVSNLSDRLVSALAGTVFLIGGIVLLRGASGPEAPPGEDAPDESPIVGSPWRVGTVAFGTVLVAELGDLTQLATASLAARTGNPLGVAIGALVALSCVAALAAFVGTRLGARLPVAVLHRVGGALFIAIGAWSLLEAARG